MNNIIFLNQYKKQKVLELSENILNEYIDYYDFDGEIDIINLLKKMNFKILFKKEFERFDNDDIMLLSIHKYFTKIYGTEKVIFVNTYYSNNLIRYNLALLLGFYIMEYRGEKCFEKRQKVYPNKNDCKIDNSVYNIFAINVLMPEEIFLEKYAEFRALHHSHIKTTIELSNFFKVPVNIVEERYYHLKQKQPKKGKIYTFKKI